MEYLPNVINEEEEYNNYRLCSSNIARTRKQIRPFNNNLFLRDADNFSSHYDNFLTILNELRTGNRNFKDESFEIIDKTIYTIQQALGIGLDLLVESNSARKHVDNRFEELIRVLLSSMDISLKKIVINIPYETDEGEKYYPFPNPVPAISDFSPKFVSMN